MKLIIPILVVGVSILMYVTYIIPAAGEAKTLSLEKARYTEVLEKTKELVTLRDTILSDYNTIPQDQVEKLNKIVPETFNAVVFMNDLNALAAKYGVAIGDFKTEPKEKPQDGLTLPEQNSNSNLKINKFQFKVVGQYAKFVSFLEALESGLQLVDVVKLHVDSGKGYEDGSLEYSLELHTYSLK